MEEKNGVMLGEAPIGKLIWKMSIPSIIGILLYNMYNIIDIIYISRGIGAYAAGGLAITFPLFILLSAISSTICAGAASIISRALGKNNIRKASKVAATTFGLFWTIALLITVLGLIFLKQLLYGMGVTDNLMPYAKDYTRIILLGAVTSTGFSSLIRAEGSSKYAMYQWVIPISVNIILDPIFIFAFDMGIKGAAVATVTAQSISVFLCLYYFFFSGKTQLVIKWTDFIPNIKILEEIIGIGLPSFIQMASQSFSIIMINQILRRNGGDITISTYGIVSKITTFLIIPLQGILQGVQPIIGYNYGAGRKHRVSETLKQSTVIAASYGVLISLSLFALSDKFMYLFSADAEIIHMGSEILRITCLGTAFSGMQMMHTAYFQVIGKSRTSLVLSICNGILFLIPLMMLFPILLGLNGVWYSFPVSAIIALGISSACIIFGREK